MASSSASPGGALLRASRVFSIPPPLPRPMGELSVRAVFSSDTATLPHPTQLSITTPPSSRAKGDWGFKRPLPLRATTKTSTPFIRVEAIDTFEHITEFGSSADHAISLQKWQEMGVALTVPVNKNTGGFRHEERKSVFEDNMDSTVEPDIESSRREDVRWNFKGPWLAGMTEGDFNAYLTRQIRDKKSEFRKYLRKACAKSLTAEARRKAIGEEEPPAPTLVEDVTEQQMTEYVKTLRHDRTELYGLIRTFLDLPPAPSTVTGNMEEFLTDALSGKSKQGVTMEHVPESASPYAKTGPPKTHPSAGLSYGLTDAQAFNHPEFGPQKFKSPVKARVVLPKNASVGNFAPALGVGGFVTAVPEGTGGSFNPSNTKVYNNRSQISSIPGVNMIEPEKVGGSKVYVEPVHAQIDPSGKVVLNVHLADYEAIAVKEGTTNQINRSSIIAGGSTKPGWKPVAGLQEAAQAGSVFARTYGLTRDSVLSENAVAKRAREAEVAKDMASLLTEDEKPL